MFAFVFALVTLVFSPTVNFCSAFPRSSLKFSPFNCGPQTWEINYANHSQASQHMMDWLLHWQFSCDGQQTYREAAHVGGFGSSFMFASKYFMEGIEYRAVYRPDHGAVQWLWADPNPQNCTLHRQSYDCFSEPISDCQYNTDVPRSDRLVNNLARIESLMAENPLRDIKSAPNMDVCTFARILKKPVKWVHGHLMWYLMRPLPELQAIIEKRKKEVLYQLPRGTVSVAMQVRAGPINDGRHAISALDTLLKVIDEVVLEIETHRSHLPNNKVGIFFLCSDLPENTYKSAEYMNAEHPRHFKWVTTHHVSLGQNSDAEQYIREHNGQLEVSRVDLFIDFLSDIEIMSSVDYVLGAKSNVYMLAAGLRMMRQQPHYRQPRNTCYIEYGGEGGGWKRVCEGDEMHKATWRYYFNPEYTHFESYPTTFKDATNRTLRHSKRRR